MRFERSVNPEGSETFTESFFFIAQFERSVNPEGSETIQSLRLSITAFERSVNPEGSETVLRNSRPAVCLREV